MSSPISKKTNWTDRLKKVGFALFPAIALLAGSAAYAPADAHDGWGRDRDYRPRHYRERVVVRPAPIYVAPRYAPPPVIYAAPPVFHLPRLPFANLSINIPLR